MEKNGFESCESQGFNMKMKIYICACAYIQRNGLTHFNEACGHTVESHLLKSTFFVVINLCFVIHRVMPVFAKSFCTLCHVQAQSYPVFFYGLRKTIHHAFWMINE